MFTLEFDAEVDESESVTLQQYYREAMIQGYNFGFEVGTKGEGTPRRPESAARVTSGIKDSTTSLTFIKVIALSGMSPMLKY